MPWRVLAHENREWTVSVAAERRSGSEGWTLVAAFRSTIPEPRRYWIPLPISSSSKAELFLQAEHLSSDELLRLLTKALQA